MLSRVGVRQRQPYLSYVERERFAEGKHARQASTSRPTAPCFLRYRLSNQHADCTFRTIDPMDTEIMPA